MDGGGQEGLGKKEPGMGQGERLEGGRVFFYGGLSQQWETYWCMYTCVFPCVCVCIHINVIYI